MSVFLNTLKNPTLVPEEIRVWAIRILMVLVWVWVCPNGLAITDCGGAGDGNAGRGVQSIGSDLITTTLWSVMTLLMDSRT